MIRLQVHISELANGFLLETSYKPYGGNNDMYAAKAFLDAHESAQEHWIATSLEEALAIAGDLFNGKTPVPSVFWGKEQHDEVPRTG